jgi:hypothetical protein
MTIQLQNTYASNLSNIQLLQANGLEVTGASSPQGINGRIFIANGYLNTVVNETDALVPGSSTRRSEIITVAPLGYGNYFIEFEFRVDLFPTIPMSIMQIMDRGSVADKPIHTLFIDPGGILCAGLIRSNVFKVIGSVKIEKNAWNRVNLFFRSFADATGWLHSIVNARTLGKKHSINFFEPSGLGPYLKNGLYDYFGLSGYGSYAAKYRNMKISSITTETYFSEMGGYPMRSL